MMRTIRWILVGWLALFAAGIVFDVRRRHDAPAGPVPGSHPPPTAFRSSSPWTGSAACVGRTCHGGLEPRVGAACLQNEYTTILDADPHARVYDVLFNERSQTMARLLGQADGHAHQMPRCLACHATPLVTANPPASQDLIAAETHFGVGCESCHGPATNWIDPHYQPHPKRRPGESPSWPGFVALNNPTTRAATCAQCHVGAPATSNHGLRDVDHDLIAAGHPRLLFEFVALEDALPPHWKLKSRDVGHQWFVGQVEGAKASLALLRDRVTRTAPWPEFSEYDCFACHHDLTPTSWRQTGPRSRKAGTLPWNSWSATIIIRLLELQGLPTEDWRQLRSTMEQLAPPDAAKLVTLIDRAATRLGELAARAEHWRGPLGPMRSLLASPNWKTSDSWEEAEQFFFALKAHHRSTGDADSARQLSDLERHRGLQAGFDSPRGFDPSTFFGDGSKSKR